MNKVLTVLQINNYIQQMFEEDFILNEIFIKGEISNFKNKGHLYFTLKDDFAAISCIMFSSNAKNLKFKLENGINVILFGRISVYEKTGVYQIYVELIQPEGLGELHLSFEQLKAKLDSEGIFDSYHKKQLPKNPSSIALITSPTGAVVQDMIQITKRRNPGVNLLVVPTLTQGEDAPQSIASALESLALYNNVDMAILARGGGSTEDLWAFNEEIVARAIFRFPIPIVSAIGHETDFTISDFVADVRASTPSSAIEISVPNLNEQILSLNSSIQSINALINMRILAENQKFYRLISRPPFLYPTENINKRRTLLFAFIKNLNNQLELNFTKQSQNIRLAISLLNTLSPLNILDKGYSIIYKDKKMVKSVNELNNGDKIIIKLKDGETKAEVK